jgi:uncharacterized membrane protein YeiH
LWLALLTVFVNALVGAARGYTDTSRQWDIVGVSVFALLMGLGGGFIRDTLIGNLPAESLRSPWALVTVLVAIVVVHTFGRHLPRLSVALIFLNAIAMGLFAVTGAAYALHFNLPWVSAILIGTISAVGGGVLVSVLQGQVPTILLASAPNALIAVWGAATYVALAWWSPTVAAMVGIVAVVTAQYVVDHTGLQTRPAARAA